MIVVVWKDLLKILKILFINLIFFLLVIVDLIVGLFVILGVVLWYFCVGIMKIDLWYF